MPENEKRQIGVFFFVNFSERRHVFERILEHFALAITRFAGIGKPVSAMVVAEHEKTAPF